MDFITRLSTSLDKIFPDTGPSEPFSPEQTALGGEVFAFQAAYRSPHLIRGIKVELDSPLSPAAAIRRVGLVPSEMPCYENHDDLVLRAAPGLFPDPLIPIDGDGIDALPSQWHAVWVSIDLTDSVNPGSYPVALRLIGPDGTVLSSESFTLRVLNAVLPPQELIHTEWFHQDCIADRYGTPVHSEAHWTILEKYVSSAAAHGITMLLTPVFTPPLDTAIGGERPTVQLVGVERLPGTNGREFDYSFDFTALERWIDLCESCGIRYFEFSHLATQWGAKHPPKIIARENGVEKRIFGWDDSSTGSRYREFLARFLPLLDELIRRKGIEKRSYFHVSDEPHMDHLEKYREVGDFLRGLLPGYPFIDALSDFEFYRTGAVPHPIPANNHIQEFLENRVPGLWTYYCCGQYRDVSNRFFDMPSVRNRILGYQLYKFRIEGFLHWGFDFWYTQHSRKKIDPWKVTDAGHAFPSGDAFLVYPGPDGPVDSIRYEVLREALQDLRLFRLAEKEKGRDAVIEAFERDFDGEVTFSSYPSRADDYIRRRERVIALIDG